MNTRQLSSLFVGTALLATSGLAPQTPERIVVPLKEVSLTEEQLLLVTTTTAFNTVPVWSFKTAGKEPSAAISAQGIARLIMLSLVPSKNYRIPPLKRRSEIFAISLNAGLERFAALLGSQNGKEDDPFDQLWIDWDRDRQFSDAELVSGKSITIEYEKVICFGPINVPSGTGRPSKLCLMLPPALHAIAAPDFFLIIQSGAIRTGELLLAGKRMKLVLIDSNLDGMFDPKSVIDMIKIDANLNGEFEVIPGVPGNDPIGEAAYFTDFMQLPNGGLYEVSLAASASEIVFERDLSKYGKISGFASGSTVSANVRGISASFLATDGSISLPPGPIELSQASFAQPDKQGRLYSYEVTWSENLPAIEVVAGKAVSTPNCLPLRIDLRIVVGPDGVTIYSPLLDRFQGTVQVLLGPDKKEIEGHLTILDGKKNKVHEASAGYASWKFPKGAVGPFTVVVNYDLGPFGNLKASSQFTR